MPDAVIRQRLIHMLAVTYDLPIEAGAMTQFGWQRETVLELLIRLLCAKLTDAVRQGMPHHYLDTKTTCLRSGDTWMRHGSSLRSRSRHKSSHALSMLCRRT